LRNVAPDLISIVVANTLLIGSMIVIARGLVLFFGIRQNNWFDLLCLFFVVASVSFFTYRWSQINMRIVVVSLAVFVINIRCSCLVYKHSANMVPFRNWMLSSMFAWVSICFLARGIYSIIFTAKSNDLMAAGAVQSLSIMAFTIGTIGIYVGLIIMNSQRVEADLHSAQNDIKTLKGFIPICARCKKVRDDEGFWNQIESYISKHSEAQFSHGICPECAKELYPEFDLYPEPK
jgi:hypothetical protein